MSAPFTKDNERKIINILFWLILLAGAAMRIHFHFMGRSLWEDEAHIALNFMHLDYKGLTQPLENYQTAPIFFLFSVEAFSDLFGFSPVALRSFPFLVSILCYPLFYFFVRDLTQSKPTALIAFLIFGVNASLIYYSSEIKSYTIDVCVYVLIGFITVSENAFVCRNRRLLLGIAGALSIPYSNATPVILLCTGLYLLVVTKEKNFPKHYWGVFLLWLASFSINYYLFIYNHPYGEGMKQIWKDSFAPVNIFSKQFGMFIGKRIDDTLFSDMLFLTDRYLFPYLTGILLITAVAYVIAKKKSKILLFTLLPIVVHLLLSMFKIYPFFFRFILYLLPCIIVLLSIGIVAIAEQLKRRLHPVVAAAFVLFCCYCSVGVSAKKFVTMEYPLWHREIKPAINFINTGYHDTYTFVTTPHTLYVYYLETGYAKNTHYEPIDVWIDPKKYFEKVSKSETDYLLLYSVDGYADGYGPIIKELEKRHLIVKRMEHATYGVMQVKPLKDTANAK